jgi:hypothetical protein
MGFVAALTGCGSRSGSVGGGAEEQDLASMHVTSVVLANKWTQVLYNLQGALPPGCGSGVFDRGADGKGYVDEHGERWDFKLTFASTCQLQYELQKISFDSKTRIITSVLEEHYLGGRVLRSLQTSNDDGRKVFTQNITLQYTLPATGESPPSGDTLSYVKVTDTGTSRLDRSDDVENYTGDVRFADRPNAKFTLKRDFGLGSGIPGRTSEDLLEMTLSDNSRFALHVPRENRGGEVPRFGEVTTGTYETGSNDRRVKLSFELQSPSSTARQWTQWRLTTPVRGFFTLNRDLSGQGQIYQADGQAIAQLISFPSDGHRASVTLTGEDTATTAGPSAAALAFLRHAWQYLQAKGAPAPGT